MNPNVIFVGAGPVGLKAAIEMKLYDHTSTILMFDKREQYTRSHSLWLESNAFANSHPNPAYQALLRDMGHSIRTNELESRLKKFAADLGIEFKYQNIENVSALTEVYPDVKLIIGTDGSRSIVRKEIFHNDMQCEENLRYIAEVKYNATGSARALNKLSEVSPALTYTHSLVSEYVGKEKEGVTPIALRIFIDEATYHAMSEATFAHPFTLNDLLNTGEKTVAQSRLLHQLHETCQAWLLARKELTGETADLSSERVTVTNLPIYASRHFVTQKDGVSYFLSGDAGLGLPYFRGANVGLASASYLAKAAHGLLSDSPIKNKKFVSSFEVVVSPADYYETHMQNVVQSENRLARFKDAGVSMLNSYAESCEAVPLSRAKLTFTEPGRNYKAAMNVQRAGRESSPAFGSFFSKTLDEEATISQSPKSGCIIL